MKKLLVIALTISGLNAARSAKEANELLPKKSNVIGSTKDLDRPKTVHQFWVKGKKVETSKGIHYLVNKTDKNLVFDIYNDDMKCRDHDGKMHVYYPVNAGQVVQTELRTKQSNCTALLVTLYMDNDRKFEKPLTPPGTLSFNNEDNKSLIMTAMYGMQGLNVVINEADDTTKNIKTKPRKK